MQGFVSLPLHFRQQPPLGIWFWQVNQIYVDDLPKQPFDLAGTDPYRDQKPLLTGGITPKGSGPF
jgi:hypothetical protein